MPDAPATNNAQQDGRREGNGWWGILQVRDRPRYACAGGLTQARVIANRVSMGSLAIWWVQDNGAVI